MTLAKCGQNFIELLADVENRVIALSGKWGTGKSHLWRDVQATSKDEQIKAAVYVSLFGLSSVTELKLRIAQGVLPKLNAGGGLTESIKDGYAGIKKVLKSIHSGFSALDELALIAAPMMIKGRFIVIDDIERKHDRLSIDEILGFIDDCVQSLDCRILLVLNSDQLGDRKLWELFREKVIDRELRLSTSPSEAFEIATELTPTPYGSHIKSAVESCQITNIRIVRKIIRVVNRLLANRRELPPEVLDRVIPSTTLLSAIHYKGMEDGPSLDFVLNFQRLLIARVASGTKSRDIEETPEEKAQERWQLLLDKLGIHATDEFEALVIDYLSSGLFEGAAISRIIDRYLVEGRGLAVRARVEDFFERCTWHPEISEAELLNELKAMLPDVGQLDMFSVTSLNGQAMRLAGGDGVARELIDTWLVAFRQRHLSGSEPELDPEFDYFRRPMHPEIATEIRLALAHRQSKMTLLNVCKRVSADRAWGTLEENFMRSMTPTDYEEAIRAATGADLKLILLQSMNFFKNRHSYDPRFGNATQSFLDACRAIVQNSPGTRLSRLIADLFRSSRVESELASHRTDTPGGMTPDHP